MLGQMIRTIKDAAEKFGLAANGKLDEATAAIWQSKLLSLHKSIKLDLESPGRYSPHIPCDQEHQVFEWHKAPIGTLVTRSNHWWKWSQSMTDNGAQTDQNKLMY